MITPSERDPISPESASPESARVDSAWPPLISPQASSPEHEDPATSAVALSPLHGSLPREVPLDTALEDAPAGQEDRPLFQSWYQPERTPPLRTPNLGHLLLLAALALIGLLGSSLTVRLALHFRLFGVSTAEKAATDVHYTIGSMAALYVITLGLALIVFPIVWHKSFLAGLHWNAKSAAHHFRLLLGSACVCFLLAMVDEVLLPGPTNAPIDKLFESRSAAWLLFGFGVTFAPFFEEAVFRGFLVPALCTAFDWCIEKATHSPALSLDPEGHPRWSLSAMVFASISASVPFALMHAEQTAWSLGPFLLLVCVSLVLCWARLATRSLAASVLVHASYNFLLFFLMLLGTQGFKHLDKM